MGLLTSFLRRSPDHDASMPSRCRQTPRVISQTPCLTLTKCNTCTIGYTIHYLRQHMHLGFASQSSLSATHAHKSVEGLLFAQRNRMRAQPHSLNRLRWVFIAYTHKLAVGGKAAEKSAQTVVPPFNCRYYCTSTVAQ